VVRISVGRKYSLAAGETKEFSAYTVPDATKFKLLSACVHFPAGTESKVEVTVWHGIKQVIPEEGSITGDDTTLCFETEAVYESGSSVIVKAVNNDTANPKEFSIELEGELE